jgi:hypothetical protein
MGLPGFTANTSLSSQYEPYKNHSLLQNNNKQWITPQYKKLHRSGSLALVCDYDDKTHAWLGCEVYHP